MKNTWFRLGLMAAVLAAATPLWAQDWPSACGKDDVQYSVKTKKEAFAAPAADPANAKVVFIEDLDGAFNPGPTVRFAVDGAWVGAARGKSYFVTSVPAGKHSFCGSRQAKTSMDKENRGVGTATLEAGKTYYFALKITRSEGDVQRGGAAGGNSMGIKPDLDVRNADYTDKATFAAISEERAKELLVRSQLSTFTTK